MFDAGLSRNDQDATSRLIESLQRLMNTTALLGFDWDQNLDALLPARMTDSANQPASGSRAGTTKLLKFTFIYSLY